jgi:hypothetical protein
MQLLKQELVPSIPSEKGPSSKRRGMKQLYASSLRQALISLDPQ